MVNYKGLWMYRRRSFDNIRKSLEANLFLMLEIKVTVMEVLCGIKPSDVLSCEGLSTGYWMENVNGSGRWDTRLRLHVAWETIHCLETGDLCRRGWKQTSFWFRYYVEEPFVVKRFTLGKVNYLYVYIVLVIVDNAHDTLWVKWVIQWVTDTVKCLECTDEL